MCTKRYSLHILFLSISGIWLKYKTLNVLLEFGDLTTLDLSFKDNAWKIVHRQDWKQSLSALQWTEIFKKQAGLNFLKKRD